MFNAEERKNHTFFFLPNKFHWKAFILWFSAVSNWTAVFFIDDNVLMKIWSFESENHLVLEGQSVRCHYIEKQKMRLLWYKANKMCFALQI